jgi:hypothetical protein
VAGRFAFTAFPATVYANLPAGGKVSVSRETNVAVKPTIGVGVGPRYLAPKVSESLINNGLGFNRRGPPIPQIPLPNQPSTVASQGNIPNLRGYRYLYHSTTEATKFAARVLRSQEGADHAR